MHALLVGGEDAAGHVPVDVAHVAQIDGSYAPGAWAAAVSQLTSELSPSAVVAAGSDRGNEVLARVAARRATCRSPRTAARSTARPSSASAWAARCSRRPASTRTCSCSRWPRSRWPRRPPARRRRCARSRRSSRRPTCWCESPSGSRPRPRASRWPRPKMVVSGGRGVGSAEGFVILEELAGLLNAAVGCSRVVTSAGWRPHTDQVGQTGTRSRPRLHRLRDQRRDPAHRRLQGRQDHRCHQRRRRRADAGPRRTTR